MYRLYYWTESRCSQTGSMVAVMTGISFEQEISRARGEVSIRRKHGRYGKNRQQTCTNGSISLKREAKHTVALDRLPQ